MANLFDYPRDEYSKKLTEIQNFLDTHYNEAGEHVREFINYALHAETLEMEELYTRTYDVQAITTLDLGYVLFGDDYKRGEILSNLNREIVNAKIDSGGELADHLPNVLRLLSKLENSELIEELASEIIHPALTIMISEFNPKRLDQKNKLYKKHYKTLIATSNLHSLIFEKPLKALQHVLKEDFQFAEKIIPTQSSDFLKSVDEELRIENEHS
jgi:nitrate reductase assembly molybdenum cofactor insertion protein NarJ